jgi:hypothetical protein
MPYVNSRHPYVNTMACLLGVILTHTETDPVLSQNGVHNSNSEFLTYNYDIILGLSGPSASHTDGSVRPIIQSQYGHI